MPVRPLGRDLIEQIAIEALVDDAEESEARMRNVRLIGRLGECVPRFAEVRSIDAARKCVNSTVLIPFGLV